MKYFDKKEFKCNGRNVFENMNADFLKRLDQCREVSDVPFVITSSYRSPQYNARIGGAKKSMHIEGRAVDIAVHNGSDRISIIKACIELGLSFGVGKNFIHIDDREIQTCWGY